MFGIDDPGIILPYTLAFCCLIFALWFGITCWHKDDNDTPQKPQV